MELGVVRIRGCIGLVFHEVRQAVNKDHKKQGTQNAPLWNTGGDS